MLLLAEILMITVLVIALIILILEESKIKKSKIPRGTVKEYWNGQERRQAQRVNVSLVVRYSIEKKHHVKLDGHMRDVSSGGMQLLVNEKLPDATILLLEFELPVTKKPICAEGKVIWSKGNFSERDELGRRVFQTGIQFVNIKPEDKNRLAEYIDNHSEKKPK